jgi:hypothetical protein
MIKELQGIFYPPSTKLLVIATKFYWAKRILVSVRVEALKVGLRQYIEGFMPKGRQALRLVPCFLIKGEHQPNEAQKALMDAKRAKYNDKIPSIVGLHAAARMLRLRTFPANYMCA